MKEVIVAELYNSLERKKGQLENSGERVISIYHCGPTVYKRPHLGNMRRFLFADFLGRTLKLLGYQIKVVTNITDVGHLTQDDIDAGEDKLEVEARRLKLDPQQIAREVEKIFFEDLQALNVESADFFPRATEHIAEMQEMIRKLLADEHAYILASGIYFDVGSYPDYGRLSGNSPEALNAGARVKVRVEKRNPADFALWILNDKKQIQQWDSPWGRGYPGWHIECSAMSNKYLPGTIDIHTGGEDNKFPHHENERAQSEAFGVKPFVGIWLHNSHLMMKGAKLAKREGEQLTVDSLVARGYSPLAFRLLMLGAHYRTKLSFSWQALAAAAENIQTVRAIVRKLGALPQGEIVASAKSKVVREFKVALADDLNTPKALVVFFGYLKDVNKLIAEGVKSDKWRAEVRLTLMAMDSVIGVVGRLEEEMASETLPEEIKRLAATRGEARRNGEFDESDRLRVEIESNGFTVEDTPDGQRIFPK